MAFELFEALRWNALYGRDIRLQPGRRVSFHAYSDVPSIPRARAMGYTEARARDGVARYLASHGDVLDIIVRGTEHVIADDTIQLSVVMTPSRASTLREVGEAIVGGLREAGAREAGVHERGLSAVGRSAIVVDPESVRYANVERASEPPRSSTLVGAVTNVMARDSETGQNLGLSALRETVQLVTSDPLRTGALLVGLGAVMAITALLVIRYA